MPAPVSRASGPQHTRTHARSLSNTYRKRFVARASRLNNEGLCHHGQGAPRGRPEQHVSMDRLDDAPESLLDTVKTHSHALLGSDPLVSCHWSFDRLLSGGAAARMHAYDRPARCTPLGRSETIVRLTPSNRTPPGSRDHIPGSESINRRGKYLMSEQVPSVLRARVPHVERLRTAFHTHARKPTIADEICDASHLIRCFHAHYASSGLGRQFCLVQVALRVAETCVGHHTHGAAA